MEMVACSHLDCCRRAPESWWWWWCLSWTLCAPLWCRRASPRAAHCRGFHGRLPSFARDAQVRCRCTGVQVQIQGEEEGCPQSPVTLSLSRRDKYLTHTAHSSNKRPATTQPAVVHVQHPYSKHRHYISVAPSCTSRYPCGVSRGGLSTCPPVLYPACPAVS